MNGLSRFCYLVEWWYYFLFDVFPKPQSNTTETFTPSEIAFLCFSVTLVKPEKPLKVPEVEKFYKLPDSRAVVKFRINTGFTASCFFGTLLVAFAQIKDFYILIRCSATIVSTWLDRSGLMSVIGNLSRLIWHVPKYLRLFAETYLQIL